MTIRIGMIGLDTSHVQIFTEMLHNPEHPHHIPGARVTAAYPGGSPDFPLSIDRVAGYTRLLAEAGATIANSPAEVAAQVDAVMLESADGRVHLEQFRQVAPLCKRVFIDKPFATSLQDAEAIAGLAAAHGVTLLSSSSLRYAQGLEELLAIEDEGEIDGVDGLCPLPLEETQPGLFWYGIHGVEMLYRVLGPGCVSVQATRTGLHEVIAGVWRDGRIGTLRGERAGLDRFGVTVHRRQRSRFADLSAHPKPYYASLLEQVMTMFQTGVATLPIEETLEIVRFIEAANRSRESGGAVRMEEIG